MPPLALHRHGTLKNAPGPNAIPLVLLHGFLCAGAFFAPNLASLTLTHPHQSFVTLDLPGFGDSAPLPPAATIATMAQQVLHTLTTANIPHFRLLGHSMGGMVALQTAITAPSRVTSLILYATGDSGDLPDRFETFAESKQHLTTDFETAKQKIAATWFTKGKRHPHFPLVASCASRVTLNTAHLAIDAMSTFDARPHLSTLKTPTTLISAENDLTYPLAHQKAFHTRLPGATHHIIPNTSHCAHLESPLTFNQLLPPLL